jgi:para-nitrobenzyl esterase
MLRLPLICSLIGALVLNACGDDETPPADSGSEDAAADATPDADGMATPPPVVSTPSGPVQGQRGLGYLEFLGIPYAEPPVGDLRFAPPQPHPGWTEPVVSARSSGCPQAAFGLNTGDEDCLYVNVHTPDPMPEDAPVMVWIHGGAYIFGEGVQTDGGTRGDLLAKDHGVVVVSMNYRLGSFGFFVHGDDVRGNFGIQDQRLALEWVQTHIASFGGDPENVTLFGESAGGQSVCLHLVSPESRGLFTRAISQSGFCAQALPTIDDMRAISDPLVAALGCDTEADPMTCMRDKTRDELIDADVAPSGMSALTAAGSWWPNVDGTVIPDQFEAVVGTGEIAEVPTIIGWNKDEGTLFVMLAEQAGLVVDEAAYTAQIAALASNAGVDAADVEAQYPIADYADPGAALAAATGHAAIICPSRRAARLLADRVETRVYRFEYPNAAFQLGATRELGAFHSAEIQYVFGHPSQLGRVAHSGDDLTLFETMSGYWTRYATSGEPGGSAAPVDWPLWDEATDTHLAIDVSPSTGVGADADPCTLWGS